MSEVWRVELYGKKVILKTTPESARVMDEALVFYDRALRRLAER